MKKSEKNRNVIENFILYYTHQNIDEATGEARDMYDSLNNYIEDDHVDGIDADDPEEDIREAKQLLANSGYFVDNLWSVIDVKDNYETEDGQELTDDQAFEILEDSLTNDATYEQIWFAIDMAASDNYKRKENGENI